MTPISQLKFTLIGKISKISGYKGEVIIVLEPDIFEIPKTELVFIEIDKLPVPFFISTIKQIKPDAYIVKFSDIDNEYDAENIVKRNVLSENIKTTIAEKEKQQGLENYKIFNKGTEIGTFLNLINIPSNPLIEILTPNNKTLTIPLNENLIESVNEQKKHLNMKLPEGLLELNISK